MQRWARCDAMPTLSKALFTHINRSLRESFRSIEGFTASADSWPLGALRLAKPQNFRVVPEPRPNAARYIA